MGEIQITMPPQAGKTPVIARQPNQAGAEGDSDSFANVLSASRQGDVAPSVDENVSDVSKAGDQPDREDAGDLAAVPADFVADVISRLGMPAIASSTPTLQDLVGTLGPSDPAHGPESDKTAVPAANAQALPTSTLLPDQAISASQAGLQPAVVQVATAGANEKLRAAQIQTGLSAVTGPNQREFKADALPTTKYGNGPGGLKAGPDSQDAPGDPAVLLPTGGEQSSDPTNTFTFMAHPAGASEAARIEPAATRFVASHVESPSWNKDFGQNVIRLTTEGRSTAEIHLNPPDWGPIHISVKMDGDDATLMLVAEHLGTREALNAAIPHLRELFHDAGMNIVDAAVAAEGQSLNMFGSDTGTFDRDARPAPAVTQVLAGPVEVEAAAMVGHIASLPPGRQVDLFA